MKTYRCELKGEYGIIFHRDDVRSADLLEEWRRKPDNKKTSRAGDDRSPPWTWQTYLYHDGEHIAMPQENIMSCLRTAGAQITLKQKKTFKAMTQIGLLITEPYWEFLGPRGRKVSMADVTALHDRPFSHQDQEVQKLGFELLVKRARIGRAKNVRVRAMFRNWSVRGNIIVREEAITHQVLSQLFEIAGKYVGLLDWRPSAPESPGPYGIFSSTITAID